MRSGCASAVSPRATAELRWWRRRLVTTEDTSVATRVTSGPTCCSAASTPDEPRPPACVPWGKAGRQQVHEAYSLRLPRRHAAGRLGSTAVAPPLSKRLAWRPPGGPRGLLGRHSQGRHWSKRAHLEGEEPRGHPRGNHRGEAPVHLCTPEWESAPCSGRAGQILLQHHVWQRSQHTRTALAATKPTHARIQPHPGHRGTRAASGATEALACTRLRAQRVRPKVPSKSSRPRTPPHSCSSAL